MEEKKGGTAIIRLTAHQVFTINEICNRMNLDRSKVIRFAIDQFLEKYEKSVRNEKQL
ncbi:hypothetical protein [Phocaeicola paurosaccharolyticus]|uniref:hypothetical protein n=1 Tax=Phocaeicola paurosaccharolyticus TaxID=732242 RepID=UPI000A4AA7C1|nr:hypothetical protein [Phocaeicola paurosaccharolyticus]